MSSLEKRTLNDAVDILVGAGEQGDPGVEVGNTSSSPHALMIRLEEQASALQLALRAIHNEEQGILRPELEVQRSDINIPNTAKPDSSVTSILKNETEVRRALLHQRRNALLPIARLPPEVIIQILHEVVHDDWSDVPMVLRALILVSREWRALVEETPSLWCHIILSRSYAGPSYLVTALKRSQNLLLTINYHYQFTTNITPEFFLGEICKHMQRWRSVKLSLDGHLEDFSLLNGALPEHLERFEIDIHINLGLPLSLFGNRRPPIFRYIRLGGCTVNWDSVLFKNLKSLDIGSSYPGEGPSIAQLLGALQHCPELERLRLLFGDFPRGSPSQHDSRSAIHLPKLQSLWLWIVYTHILEILTTVQIPACEILDLRTSIPSGQWPIFASEALQPHVAVISSISKAARNVDWEWSNGSMGVSTKSDPARFRGMRLSFTGVSENQSQVLDWLVDKAGVERVGVPTHLKLYLPVWTADTPNMLSRIKSTTSMEITSDAPFQRQLLAWLGTPLKDIWSDTNRSFPLPRLAVIEGVYGFIVGAIVHMVQSRHGGGRLGSITVVDLPSPLSRIRLRLKEDQPALDRAFYRQLEEAMDGGEVLVDEAHYLGS
ncbi:hypothetical protein FS837_001794 [Tulasnella sp. UAMH 9824]|nr:hypothetical protein FS837_001794 [Tulasnella sp. UAMH 9824]